MTISAPEEQPFASDLLGALSPTEEIDTAAPPRGGPWRRWLYRGLFLAMVLGGVAVAFAYVSGSISAGGSGTMLTHVVRKGELLVTITEDGALESANNVDIKCEVAGGSTILWIVEDGSEVEKGAELARLDSSQLEDQINQQKITYEKARTTFIQAEKDFNVAKIAVEEYLEGTFRQQLQDLEAQITIALENLRSAENTLRHTERMFRKGYVSPLQLEAQEFAVQRAQLELDSARTAKDVLERFTKKKTLEELHSQRDTAEARANSEKAAHELEKARLERLQAQLEKCVILAPQSGMVVYANPVGGGRRGPPQQTPQIEEGAQVREAQTMFRLPDLSQMQVKVAVHESKVDQLRLGMRARIRVQDDEYQGSVVSIANQPESASFFSTAVKEYATIVEIDGERGRIRPGMTAEAEILVTHLKNVLTLPVAAVVQQRGGFLCWVKTGAQEEPQRRPLVLGMSDDKVVEIKDGVTAGEAVILNPRAVVADARDTSEETETVDVEKRFGGSAGDEEAAPDDRPGRRGPASEPGTEDQGGPRAGGEGPRRGGQGGGPGGMDPMQYDQDGDGRLSRSELPEPMRDRFMERADGNGDGFVDRAELEQMRSRMREEGGPRGGGGGDRRERGGGEGPRGPDGGAGRPGF